MLKQPKKMTTQYRQEKDVVVDRHSWVSRLVASKMPKRKLSAKKAAVVALRQSKQALHLLPAPAFIRDWAPGTDITKYVISATIEAIKAAA